MGAKKPQQSLYGLKLIDSKFLFWKINVDLIVIYGNVGINDSSCWR